MNFIKRVTRRTWLACGLLGALVGAGCGGGGGSDRSDISLSSETVTLESRIEDDQHPAAQSVDVTVQGSDIAAVVAGYGPGVAPAAWLSATVTGGGKAFALNLGLAAPAPLGANTTSLVLAGVRADGSVVTQKTLRVDYTVLARLRADQATLTFDNINGAAPPASRSVQVTGAGLAWQATADQPWVRLSAASGTAPAAVSIDVDDAGLAAGVHTATVMLSAAGGQSVVIPVTYNLMTAALSTSATSLAFGGADGRDAAAQSLQFALNTGTEGHAWSLQGLPAWLTASSSGGNVSAAGQTLTLTPDLGKAAAGVSTATLQLTAVVNGDTLSRRVEVSLETDSHRLYAVDDGVALVSVPGWSRLAHTTRVLDNLGRATPWTASSNQPWLTVTASGAAGGALTLTADPATLTTNLTSYATVTVQSSDTTVAGTSLIRVALWKGSTTPTANISRTATAYTTIKADPIRPWILAHSGGTSVDIYSAYTGNLLRTLSDVGTALGTMAISSNGDRLYVAETGARRIAVVNLQTFAKGASINTSGATDAGFQFISSRTRGVELLFAGDGSVYRAADGQALASGSGLAGMLAADRSGGVLFSLNSGLSPFTASRLGVDYSTVGGGTLLKQPAVVSAAGNNGQDIAVRGDASVAYLASSGPDQFLSVNGGSMSSLGALPGGDTPSPTSIEVASDDRMLGGVASRTNTNDLWLYQPNGTVKSRMRIAAMGQTLLPRQLVFSGDAMMAAALSSDPKLTFIVIGP